MRNLKRTLSLALASVMLVGMMSVGASAVNASDFTDADEIVNKDAVSTMTALGIINGKEDGSYFDPTGTVTRARWPRCSASPSTAVWIPCWASRTPPPLPTSRAIGRVLH